MSHVDHIERVKNKLRSLGQMCPFKHRELLNNAYIDALVAAHFKCNATFFLTATEIDKYRCQMDKWNSVAPFDFECVANGYIGRINKLSAQLATYGYPTESYCICVNPEDAEHNVDLRDLQEYKDLVAYLVQEVKNKHE